MKRVWVDWFLFQIILWVGLAIGQEPVGNIAGKVNAADGKFPLIGAEIQIKGLPLGAATDLDGHYEIRNVPVGSYVLMASYLGYEKIYKADIIVKPGRTTFVNFEMLPKEIVGDGVTVSAGYFPELIEPEISTVAFSSEEIRRAPGSAGDVSRILMSLPSVAKVNDQSNGLIVRGGSPMENQILLDGFEIPNINHFPVQGSTAGPISVLNADLIDEVTFTAGGFSAEYGDRLSAVMDIALREGNKKENDYQLDLNIAGFGGLWEGPLAGGDGSFLVGMRRSYLDLVVDWFNTGTTLAPRYGDFITKWVVPVGKKHSFTFLGLFSDDHIHSDYQVARENDMITYGKQDDNMWLGGIKWRAFWNNKHLSELKVSFTGMKFDDRAYETNTRKLLLQNISEEPYGLIELNTYHQLFSNLLVKSGAGFRLHFSKYNQVFGQWTEEGLHQSVVNKKFHQNDWSSFVNANWRIADKFSLNFGIRWNYYSWYQKSKISPRASLKININPVSFIQLAFGEYYQSLPSLFLIQLNEKTAKVLKNRQWAASYNCLLSENTRLTLEAYYKAYDHLPIDPEAPKNNILDEVYGQFYFYGSHQDLIFNGKARAKGLELTIQKKMAQNLYGLFSIALSSSKYRDGEGAWRNRVYDNRIILSAEGGYKFNKKYEVSGRWIYAGGTPYTPIDLQASQKAGRTIPDDARFLEERLPAYHSLNLRMDRRFYFRRTSLTVYVSAWNVYDRKNIAQFYYNDDLKAVKPVYQWRILPIFGVEYEF